MRVIPPNRLSGITSRTYRVHPQMTVAQLQCTIQQRENLPSPYFGLYLVKSSLSITCNSPTSSSSLHSFSTETSAISTTTVSPEFSISVSSPSGSSSPLSLSNIPSSSSATHSSLEYLSLVPENPLSHYSLTPHCLLVFAPLPEAQRLIIPPSYYADLQFDWLEVSEEDAFSIQVAKREEEIQSVPSSAEIVAQKDTEMKEATANENTPTLSPRDVPLTSMEDKIDESPHETKLLDVEIPSERQSLTTPMLPYRHSSVKGDKTPAVAPFSGVLGALQILGSSGMTQPEDVIRADLSGCSPFLSSMKSQDFSLFGSLSVLDLSGSCFKPSELKNLSLFPSLHTLCLAFSSLSNIDFFQPNSQHCVPFSQIQDISPSNSEEKLVPDETTPSDTVSGANEEKPFFLTQDQETDEDVPPSELEVELTNTIQHLKQEGNDNTNMPPPSMISSYTFSCLQHLDLSHNCFDSHTTLLSICSLSLITLSLSYCSLSSLPSNWYLPLCRTLSLRGNRLGSWDMPRKQKETYSTAEKTKREKERKHAAFLIRVMSKGIGRWANNDISFDIEEERERGRQTKSQCYNDVYNQEQMSPELGDEEFKLFQVVGRFPKSEQELHSPYSCCLTSLSHLFDTLYFVSFYLAYLSWICLTTTCSSSHLCPLYHMMMRTGLHLSLPRINTFQSFPH